MLYYGKIGSEIDGMWKAWFHKKSKYSRVLAQVQCNWMSYINEDWRQTVMIRA